jgi:hypothetical protein
VSGSCFDPEGSQRATLPLQPSHQHQRDRAREGEQSDERKLVSRPARPRAFDGPEAAEARQHHADCELDPVLGYACQGGSYQHTDGRDGKEGGTRGSGGERQAALAAVEADDDESDLEPFKQDALEGEGECVPVEARPFLVGRSGRLVATPPERGRLIA